MNSPGESSFTKCRYPPEISSYITSIPSYSPVVSDCKACQRKDWVNTLVIALIQSIGCVTPVQQQSGVYISCVHHLCASLVSFTTIPSQQYHHNNTITLTLLVVRFGSVSTIVNLVSTELTAHVIDRLPQGSTSPPVSLWCELQSGSMKWWVDRSEGA